MILLFQTFATPAQGCVPAMSCVCDIDGFFLGLMAGAGVSGGAPIAAPLSAVTQSVSPFPPHGGPFVIPPAAGRDATTPVTAADLMHPYLLEQWIVADRVIDGGESWMYLHTSPSGSAAQKPVPPFVRTGSFGGAGAWRRTHRLALPTFPAWPLKAASQPVGMTVSCGVCDDGAFAEMTGNGILEFSLVGHGMPGATVSSIRDIALRGPAGLAAGGMIRFVLRTANGPVATAEKARLLLDFNHYRADVRLHLLVWLHADGRAGGAFTGVAGDPEWGLGALAGYFSGAGCRPACGVEN